MKLIGFAGPMGAGKTTAIDHMRKLTKTPIVVIKFAGPLYAMQDFIYKTIKPVHIPPSNFVKDRKLLQWLGTDWGRDTISPTLWVDLWKAEIKYCQENYPGTIIVCDDVRFDNEANAVHYMGGVVVRLITDGATDRAEGGTGIVAHKSESGISDKLTDYTVYNTGSLDQFRASLSSLYQGMIKI